MYIFFQGVNFALAYQKVKKSYSKQNYLKNSLIQNF